MGSGSELCSLQGIRSVNVLFAAKLTDLHPVDKYKVVLLSADPLSGKSQIVKTVLRHLDQKDDAVVFLGKAAHRFAAGRVAVAHDLIAAEQERVLRLINLGFCSAGRGAKHEGQEQGKSDAETRASPREP